MFQGLRTVIYHVAELEKAKAWYTELLGVAPYFDEPFYVGFNVGGYELGLHPLESSDASTRTERVVTYWGVPNAEEAMTRLLQSGATEYEALQDVGGGIRVGAVRNPFGNVVGVIENPHFTLESAG